MTKFTKEEISLCKQIAEKHKKKRLELGDWYLLKLLHEKEQIRLYGNQKPWIILTKDFIPLWTISDCLEFLRKRGWALCNHYDDLKDKNVVILFGRGESELLEGKGKADNEACLKAVLAVIKESK